MPEKIIEEVTRSAQRLNRALDALTETELREPSALPGWTRGDVVAHLAAAADAYRRLLALARTGAEPGPRPGGGAADESTAGLRTRLAGLIADAESMPAGRWDTLVTALAGWRHPAWYTLYRCRRELETHHVDLAFGYRPADWPEAYVSWALDETLAALQARDFPVARIDAEDLGRSWTLAPAGPAVSGSGHALLGWLSGRTAGAELSADGELPEPPAWPQPPVPGWG